MKKLLALVIVLALSASLSVTVFAGQSEQDAFTAAYDEYLAALDSMVSMDPEIPEDEAVDALIAILTDLIDKGSAVQAAYDDLSDQDKIDLDLEDFAETFDEEIQSFILLKEMMESIQSIMDDPALEAFSAAGEALPGDPDDLKLSDKDKVVALRAAFEDLSDDTVEALDSLMVVGGYESTDAYIKAYEDKIAALQAAADKAAADKAAADKAAKVAADKAAAKTVDDQIAALGSVTTGKTSLVAAARRAYNTLSADQKALVTKLSVLTAAESKLASLSEKENNPDTGSAAPVGALALALCGFAVFASRRRAARA